MGSSMAWVMLSRLAPTIKLTKCLQNLVSNSCCYLGKVSSQSWFFFASKIDSFGIFFLPCSTGTDQFGIIKNWSNSCKLVAKIKGGVGHSKVPWIWKLFEKSISKKIMKTCFFNSFWNLVGNDQELVYIQSKKEINIH